MLITNNKSNLIHISGKRLGPGTNQVDAAWWAKAKKHPSIKKRLELGTLEEQNEGVVADSLESDLEETPSVEAEKEMDFSHLKTLKAGQAITLVAQTVDLVLLKEWSKKEDRQTVKTALKKQLDKMEKPAEIRDRSQSRYVDTGKGEQVIEVKAKPTSQDD